MCVKAGGAYARRACLWIAMCGALAGSPSARGAHEWRGEWGAAHAGPLAERRARAAPGELRAELRQSRPFNIPDVYFDQLLLRSRGARWETHVGVLRAPGYREWHVGVGRRLRVLPQTDLLLGARVFSGTAGEEPLGSCLTLTGLVEACPAALPFLEFEAGMVDVATSPAPAHPAPLLVTRVAVRADAARVLIERTIVPSMDGETALGVFLRRGSLSLVSTLCWAAGEGSLALAVRRGRCEATLGQSWHPDLGWTPQLSLRWLAEERPS